MIFIKIVIKATLSCFNILYIFFVPNKPNFSRLTDWKISISYCYYTGVYATTNDLDRILFLIIN